jgi:hypothetical protein
MYAESEEDEDTSEESSSLEDDEEVVVRVVDKGKGRAIDSGVGATLGPGRKSRSEVGHSSPSNTFARAVRPPVPVMPGRVVSAYAAEKNVGQTRAVSAYGIDVRVEKGEKVGTPRSQSSLGVYGNANGSGNGNGAVYSNGNGNNNGSGIGVGYGYGYGGIGSRARASVSASALVPSEPSSPGGDLRRASFVASRGECLFPFLFHDVLFTFELLLT